MHKRPQAVVYTSRGFTLIELLLVMGLMAFATTLFLINFTSLINRTDDLRAEEVLREAVGDARFLAARNRRVMHLSLDQSTGDLKISDSNGQVLVRHPLGSSFARNGADDVRFTVEPQRPISQRGFIGHQGDQIDVPRVSFAPDRSGTPFTALLRINGHTDELFFEPFSGLVVTRAE